MLYANNATEENGYKLKALELYSSLLELEPEGPWASQIDALAENIDELVEIRKTAWDLDRENMEKAYKYSETCIRAEEYKKALEPLLFLTEKSPDVINYWRKLATVYYKLKNHDQAIKAYKTLIELEPNNRENFYNLALIYKDIGQLSVCRSYLQKASNVSDEPWDVPIMVEAQLYEQAARECGFEFMDKCVYQLAVDTYKKAAALGGPQATSAKDRVNALSQSVPQSEDYFFRKFKSGDKIQIEGKCYGWIQRSIVVP
jgi:tetratricopeptide (TPR) repeat protein